MLLVLRGLGDFGSHCLAWEGGTAAPLGAGPSPRPLSYQEFYSLCEAHGASHKQVMASRRRWRYSLAWWLCPVG